MNHMLELLAFHEPGTDEHDKILEAIYALPGYPVHAALQPDAGVLVRPLDRVLWLTADEVADGRRVGHDGFAHRFGGMALPG